MSQVIDKEQFSVKKNRITSNVMTKYERARSCAEKMPTNIASKFSRRQFRRLESFRISLLFNLRLADE